MGSYNIKMSETNHLFKKSNLVTQFDKKGGYDYYECDCGIKGKSYQLGMLRIDGRKSHKEVYNCKLFDNTIDSYIGKKVKVLYCDAVGKRFSNLIPNSIHVIVEPAKGYTNDNTGVWVMGVGEPVKLLTREFKYVD